MAQTTNRTGPSVLKVLITSYFPYSSTDCARNVFKSGPFCYMPGLMNEIIGLLADIMECKIEPVFLGKVLNEYDSYTAAVGQYGNEIKEMINNGTVDTAAISVEYTKQRARDYLLSDPVYYINPRFLVKKEDFGLGWWNMFKVYDKNTWAIMLAFLTIQCVVCGVIQSVQNRFVPQKERICDKVWGTLRIQLLQGHNLKFRFFSGNLTVLVFALFQCALIIGVFTSYFLSIMVRIDKMSETDSQQRIENYVKHEHKKLIATARNSWLQEKLDSAIDTMFPNLAGKDRILQLYESDKKAVDAVARDDGILFSQDDELSYFLASKDCGIEKIYVPIDLTSSRLLFRKGYPYIHKVNQALQIAKTKIVEIHKTYSVDRTIITQCSHFKIGDPAHVVFWCADHMRRWDGD
ncbi:unnamed protein product [Bursaphelenchus xylophilus]|uniref:(pine wood nematode) hypothetical protein n=1 Tax=Bursaphelenchus xylophilus TaxID=6326 RepID=A0A7I8WUV1_BURXY|nr:unnamed protein product [Bursaphelenchus xylophilus]CAG9117171.1 unnamed protein product [Bursaphelenchus xylophilus]